MEFLGKHKCAQSSRCDFNELPSSETAGLYDVSLLSSLFHFFYFIVSDPISIQYHSNPSLCPNQNAEEAEVEQFYEDLQDLLELTPKTDVLFIIGDWNAKVGSQETPGVTGKFGLGIWNEAGQGLIEFCEENALVITNTLFQ